ncbi:mechanosensitive ion channel family protein [Desulfobotulus sp.]|jgi:MscS family membrane protein|uniref:mechanosensitive ion channel family protein n=1 Tax=Desulfobotulus sp. TaxID=1940337 RepID=UPI002A362087|nr:mechanosensitive ion channel family protein [Desulfobotulus sp.]MDY0164167.1 mechanosensitive ion channel family protein [Desulfobotulus sp.]
MTALTELATDILSFLKEFITITMDIWQHGFMGIPIARYLAAAAILLFFLMLRRTVVQWALQRLKNLSQKTTTRLDDEVVASLEPPIRLLPIILGIFFALRFLELQGAAAEFSEKIIRSMVAFMIFWALYSAIPPIFRLFDQIKERIGQALLDWTQKAVKIAVMVIGAATILEMWGIKVGPVLAGFGLFGVAVALGAQDLFKNLISGILILTERRFGTGDWIHVEGVVEGTVEQIGFRSTRIRRFDKAPVFVPNSRLSDNTLTNFSAMTHRRIYWVIGLEYRTALDALRRIRDRIENHLLQNEKIVNPPEVPLFVRVDRFSDSSIDLMVYCFTRTTIWGEWLAAKEGLALAIKAIVEEEGASFAFPSRSLYIEVLPETEKPQPFIPPVTQGNAP